MTYIRYKFCTIINKLRLPNFLDKDVATNWLATWVTSWLSATYSCGHNYKWGRGRRCRVSFPSDYVCVVFYVWRIGGHADEDPPCWVSMSKGRNTMFVSLQILHIYVYCIEAWFVWWLFHPVDSIIDSLLIFLLLCLIPYSYYIFYAMHHYILYIYHDIYYLVLYIYLLYYRLCILGLYTIITYLPQYMSLILFNGVVTAVRCSPSISTDGEWMW